MVEKRFSRVPRAAGFVITVCSWIYVFKAGWRVWARVVEGIYFLVRVCPVSAQILRGCEMLGKIQGEKSDF